MTYFNTSNLHGQELHDAHEKAFCQKDAILRLFKDCQLAMPASQVHWRMQELTRLTWLLTSVRRSMSVLQNEGLLEKTDIKVKSPQGGKEYLYKLK